MAQCGESGGFNGTVFPQDLVKVQRHVWVLRWKSNADSHTDQHSPVLLSTPGLQLCSSSVLLEAVGRLWICGGRVAVGSLHHTQPPSLLQRHLHGERLAGGAVQRATLLSFAWYQPADQRAGEAPVTLRSLVSCVMSDLLAQTLYVLGALRAGVWKNLRQLTMEKRVMFVGFFLQTAGRMWVCGAGTIMVDLIGVSAVSCKLWA